MHTKEVAATPSLSLSRENLNRPPLNKPPTNMKKKLTPTSLLEPLLTLTSLISLSTEPLMTPCGLLWGL